MNRVNKVNIGTELAAFVFTAHYSGRTKGNPPGTLQWTTSYPVPLQYTGMCCLWLTLNRIHINSIQLLPKRLRTA